MAMTEPGEMTGEELLFFAGKPQALALYASFMRGLLACCPQTVAGVQKTQITLRNPKVFGCVSMMRVKSGMQQPYIVVTFGLGRPLSSPRVAACVQPYPNRWTHHVVLTRPEEADEELLAWFREAYDFACLKGRRTSRTP